MEILRQILAMVLILGITAWLAVSCLEAIPNEQAGAMPEMRVN